MMKTALANQLCGQLFGCFPSPQVYASDADCTLRPHLTTVACVAFRIHSVQCTSRSRILKSVAALQPSRAFKSVSSKCVLLQLNLLLMAFNLLLPAYPLDGGRILVDLMLIVGVPAKITAWITITIAAIMAVGLIVLGIWSFGYGFIIVGVFILINTFQLYQALSSGNITYHPLFKPTSKSSANNQQVASNV